MKRYFTRTETLAIIKPRNPLFKTIDELSFKAKNVYNSALYICRQSYFEYKTIIGYTALHSMHKSQYLEDYKSLPIQTTQQILKVVYKNMKAFSVSTKDYYNNPHKYKAKPKIPKYKHKTKGRFTLYFTNQQVKFKEGFIVFPKITGINPIKTRLDLSIDRENQMFSNSIESPIRHVRIVPLLNSYRIELVYDKAIDVPDTSKNQNLASIDLGINNFSTVVTYGPKTSRPLILNGKGLKSYNKHFNKKLANLKSKAKKVNNKHTTKAIQRLISKRNRVYRDFNHKASRAIVNYLLQNEVKCLIIGYNKQWKTNSNLSKKVNQTFIQIGYLEFIKLLTYKAQEVGIKVFTVTEEYTSGTSFLDGEQPTKEYYNKSRRIHRGLFLTNIHRPINADINAAYQILSKATNNKAVYNQKYTPKESFIPTKLSLDTFKRKIA